MFDDDGSNVQIAAWHDCGEVFQTLEAFDAHVLHCAEDQAFDAGLEPDELDLEEDFDD